MDNYEEFDSRMMRFAEQTKIWPPLQLIKIAACKWSTVQKLDDIARQVTHTMRPKTSLWDGESIPTDKVLKRCYSSYQEHVYLPSSKSPLTTPSLQKLRESSVLPGRHWMVQEWIPQLRQLGEFKVYFVNRTIVYIAITKYYSSRSVWEFRTPDRLYTLAQIQ